MNYKILLKNLKTEQHEPKKKEELLGNAEHHNTDLKT